MGRDESSWTTIESDPGVFTELIEKIGVTGVQVEEIWSLDKESLLQLSPVYGLVFLFKYVQDGTRDGEMLMEAPGVFFAQQVIPNACATQAILSILLNVPPSTSGVQLGTELTAFRDFTSELPADMKGLAISNSDLIRTVHNSLARPESLLPDEDIKKPEGGDAFHFIAYLPVGDTLYELDGLQSGPIKLTTGLKTESEWLEAVVPYISSRMERYAADEVRFNLMALVADRRLVLGQQLSQCQAQRTSLTGGDDDLSHHLDQEIARIQEQLSVETAKRDAWREENIRRRTNYIPFMFQMLTALAQKGQLKQFVDLAKEPKKQKAGGGSAQQA